MKVPLASNLRDSFKVLSMTITSHFYTGDVNSVIFNFTKCLPFFEYWEMRKVHKINISTFQFLTFEHTLGQLPMLHTQMCTRLCLACVYQVKYWRAAVRLCRRKLRKFESEMVMWQRCTNEMEKHFPFLNGHKPDLERFFLPTGSVSCNRVGLRWPWQTK